MPTARRDDPTADVPADVLVDALADVAALGPFFAVSTDPAEEVDPLWRPFPGGVERLVDLTAARLGTAEPRVAASTAHLSLAARLWSPVLGCALLHGVVPSLAALRHRAAAPGVVPLWLAELRGRRPERAQDLAEAVYCAVIDEQLEAVNAFVRERFPVAEGLLWGNAASALIGTLRVVAAARPAHAGAARDLAARLLALGRLRGTGVLHGPGLAFRRRSCCLYYRIPGGGLCGDCCLDAPPAVRR
ncbi:(2Fe-2S)-binding protein [Thermomonospora amylolytica]|uniref:(2Fe-2S)-binding protein n=1 Tax=Thermomonospora amylolytica TaxID=1411117 RepID=UPI000E6C9118|nr:(2Fe-2S)-binding protein [Thermomonospora amylolytica]